jgi:hypothetical protein
MLITLGIFPNRPLSAHGRRFLQIARRSAFLGGPIKDAPRHKDVNGLQANSQLRRPRLRPSSSAARVRTHLRDDERATRGGAQRLQERFVGQRVDRGRAAAAPSARSLRGRSSFSAPRLLAGISGGDLGSGPRRIEFGGTT